MISERAARVQPSATLAMNAKAKEMKAMGRDVISFSVGEPDFDTPEHIKEAAIKALREGKTKYTPADGIPELKEAIIEKLEKENNIKYTMDEVIVSCGAKHSLYNIAQAILSPGDEVIIPAPYWVSYPAQVLLNDAVPVIVETKEEDNFMIMPEQLEEAITYKTRALILNYPSNPTGLTYTEDTLKRIAEIAIKHNIYIISDEIYEKLLYEGKKHVSIASFSEEVKRQTIIVNGVSKSHSMTGWRIGYAAGPKDVISAMRRIQSHSTSNPTSIAQWAALEALRGPQDFLQVMLEEFDRRRRFLVEGLNSIEGMSCLMPQGAFYAFPNVKGILGRKNINDSLSLAMYLLEEAMAALVPGSAFGMEGYIRMSYATSLENLQKGLERIRDALE